MIIYLFVTLLFLQTTHIFAKFVLAEYQALAMPSQWKALAIK
jgi:hypothetical protein